MAAVYSEIAAGLKERCQAGQAKLAAALRIAFDAAYELAVLETRPWSTDEPLEQFAGPGLVFVFKTGDGAAMAVLSESAGLVPDWCSNPDTNNQQRLRTLALELGSLALSGTVSVEDCSVARVRDLAGAVTRADLSPDCAVVPLALQCDAKSATLFIVYPVASPDAILNDPSRMAAASRDAEQSSDGQKGDPAASQPWNMPSRASIRYGDLDEGIRMLPAYSRSLLKIRVPVIVTLAGARQSLDTILNIGSGSIIHFNKSCEDTLTLEVAGHKIAVGETVKVGDKFGLWITSMIMPDERFWIINGRQPPQRAR